jgi:hypothetical protein
MRHMVKVELEWAPIAEDRVLIATANRISLHRPTPMSPFNAPMRGPGSPSTTRQLLDGALEVGRLVARERQLSEADALPPITLARWVEQLCADYHTTHVTPSLMAEAAGRFARAGRGALARWAASKVTDERGHDELALRDLRALGLDAGGIVAVLRPRWARALVEYFTRAVRAADPIGCVGYAYALEGSALGVTAVSLRRIEAALPPGVHATRCIRVHSALGSDVSHVDELVGMVAGLDAGERARVAAACYETALIMSAPRDERSEAELAQLIRTWETIPRRGEIEHGKRDQQQRSGMGEGNRDGGA